MPELTTFNWIVICVCLTTLSGLATFFLKDVFKKHDKHSDNIIDIKMDYAPRSELNSATASLRAESKAILTSVNENTRDINEIKRTYVTKDELKELKGELRDDYKKLVDDVADIKENSIRKDDFYRVISDLSRTVDKVYDLMMKEKGGFGSGK